MLVFVSYRIYNIGCPLVGRTLPSNGDYSDSVAVVVTSP